ncbi:MAG: hypothetical protein QNJ05_02370 [Woeseiaceae bacterium]|nr:hypothetical protein [Woeseiaceae bacterium]
MLLEMRFDPFSDKHIIWIPVLFSVFSRTPTLGRGVWRDSISFGNYIRQLCKFVFSSSVVLGLIVGVSLLLVGETTMELDWTFKLGPFVGIWWILGLPVLSLLLLLILSPLSFLVHRPLAKTKNEDAKSDA